MLALLLWLQVAGLLWHLSDNSFLLVEAFFWAWLKLTSRWAAKFTWDLLTLSFRGILLDLLLLRFAHLLGPLGTLLLSGVPLGNILAFLLLDGLTRNNIILDIVLVVSGLTLRFVDGLTFYWSLAITDKRGVARLDLLFGGNLLVFDEAVFDKVLLALFLLLWLKVSGVGSVTLLTVAVLAFNDVIVLGLLNHDNLVDASFSSSCNGSNVKSNVVIGTLARSTGWQGQTSAWCLLISMIMVMMVMVLVVATISTSTGLLAEWEDASQILAISPLSGCR